MSVSDRLSPVLRVRASSLPEHLRLPLVDTGDLVKPIRRAFAARPAVKAANEHGLPLPRSVEAVLLQARKPPVTGNAGSKDGLASTVSITLKTLHQERK